jgi:hypothetical protein
MRTIFNDQEDNGYALANVKDVLILVPIGICLSHQGVAVQAQYLPLYHTCSEFSMPSQRNQKEQPLCGYSSG